MRLKYSDEAIGGRKKLLNGKHEMREQEYSKSFGGKAKEKPLGRRRFKWKAGMDGMDGGIKLDVGKICWCGMEWNRLAQDNS
jgi:hypothetical protein